MQVCTAYSFGRVIAATVAEAEPAGVLTAETGIESLGAGEADGGVAATVCPSRRSLSRCAKGPCPSFCEGSSASATNGGKTETAVSIAIVSASLEGCEVVSGLSAPQAFSSSKRPSPA